MRSEGQCKHLGYRYKSWRMRFRSLLSSTAPILRGRDKGCPLIRDAVCHPIVTITTRSFLYEQYFFYDN